MIASVYNKYCLQIDHGAEVMGSAITKAICYNQFRARYMLFAQPQWDQGGGSEGTRV